MSVIALLTDFGMADGYVGVMHGVILRINPAVTVVDVGHDIPPQDVHAGAFVLSTAYPHFASNTIHVVVVDPGVGSERRAIAVQTGRGTFVAPDNGVLTYVLAREQILNMVQLTHAEYWLAPLSDTFHGRDVFAPVAAHLSRGVPLSDMGCVMQDPVRLAVRSVVVAVDGSIQGEVLHVDRFGNLITNLAGELLPTGEPLQVRVAGREMCGPLGGYAQVSDGELVALFGSSGYLEIAVRNGSAARLLTASRGTSVVVTLLHRAKPS